MGKRCLAGAAAEFLRIAAIRALLPHSLGGSAQNVPICFLMRPHAHPLRPFHKAKGLGGRPPFGKVPCSRHGVERNSPAPHSIENLRNRAFAFIMNVS